MLKPKMERCGGRLLESLLTSHGKQTAAGKRGCYQGGALLWWLSGKESACRAGDSVLIPGREDPLEEGMATHCSILAWRIPWTEEPGGLQSMGSPRVGRDWSDLAAAGALRQKQTCE